MVLDIEYSQLLSALTSPAARAGLCQLVSLSTVTRPSSDADADADAAAKRLCTCFWEIQLFSHYVCGRGRDADASRQLPLHILGN